MSSILSEATIQDLHTAEYEMRLQDINVQKNQQMLSSFFFSACEVLKAGSSVKLILPHATCEVNE